MLVAPAFAVLLLTARVRRASAGWLLAGLLPVVGVALVAVAVGGALAGRWTLSAGGGALAAVALCTAVLLASPRRLRRRPAGPDPRGAPVSDCGRERISKIFCHSTPRHRTYIG